MVRYRHNGLADILAALGIRWLEREEHDEALRWLRNEHRQEMWALRDNHELGRQAQEMQHQDYARTQRLEWE